MMDENELKEIIHTINLNYDGVGKPILDVCDNLIADVRAGRKAIEELEEELNRWNYSAITAGMKQHERIEELEAVKLTVEEINLTTRALILYSAGRDDKVDEINGITRKLSEEVNK